MTAALFVRHNKPEFFEVLKHSLNIGIRKFIFIASRKRQFYIGWAHQRALPNLTENMMSKSCRTGLDDRCRDNNGEIRHKNGSTRVATLRQTYGDSFASPPLPLASLCGLRDLWPRAFLGRAVTGTASASTGSGRRRPEVWRNRGTRGMTRNIGLEAGRGKPSALILRSGHKRVYARP